MSTVPIRRVHAFLPGSAVSFAVWICGSIASSAAWIRRRRHHRTMLGSPFALAGWLIRFEELGTGRRVEGWACRERARRRIRLASTGLDCFACSRLAFVEWWCCARLLRRGEFSFSLSVCGCQSRERCAKILALV